jgi:hypothetical protein
MSVNFKMLKNSNKNLMDLKNKFKLLKVLNFNMLLNKFNKF